MLGTPAAPDNGPSRLPEPTHKRRRSTLSASVVCLASAACLSIVCFSPFSASAAVPIRVVSINVCTDQLLLALAEPDQIAALSAYARHPGMSFFSEAARAYPVVGGSAEEVMSLRPDLVLAGRFTKRTTRELLRRFGYRVLELPPADGVEQIRIQVSQIAAALGASERGSAMIADFDQRLAGVVSAGDGPRPTALYYQRRGYASGAGTLMDVLMQAAGLRNLAGELGYRSVARIPLEQVVARPPDILVVDGAALRAVDRGTELLAHPSLARAVPRERWITVAQSLTVCGGPWLVDAVADMRGQADAIRRSLGSRPVASAPR